MPDGNGDSAGALGHHLSPPRGEGDSDSDRNVVSISRFAGQPEQGLRQLGQILGPIPSNTIVVRVAPQIELLKRASLCITHAGLNTVLEALAQGVPMVAIPLGYDQPGVAARMAYHGVGEFIESDDLTAQRLSELITKVRSNSTYRDKARWFQKVLKETNGLDVAADIIERLFRIGTPTAPSSPTPPTSEMSALIN